MARFEPEQQVTLSIIDRLIDNEPFQAADPPAGRTHSLRQLKAALKRDLEWLLNTRRNPDAVQDKTTHVFKSLYNYGLPDISNLSMLSVSDQNRLLRMMELAIATFEPRLRNVRVLLEPVAPGSRALRFLIEGLLQMDPAPERISFDTLLELSSREIEIRGD